MLIRLLFQFMSRLFAFHALDPAAPGAPVAGMASFLDQLVAKRAAAQEELNAIVNGAEARGEDLNDDEAAAFDEKRSEITKLDERIAELRESIEAEQRAGQAAVAVGAQTAGTVTVKSEPLTYQRGDNRQSYFQDLGKVIVGGGDAEAQRRLVRHAAEVRERAEAEDRANPGTIDGEQVGVERRDLSRTDGSGGYFVPPAWMVDEYVALARASAVTANLVNNRPLPTGTDSINVPKVSTGTAVAVQTADNASVQETDLADTYVTLPVRTIAGQQDVALQALEQSPIAFDEMVFGDLTGDHAAKKDQQVLYGSGSSGQVVGLYNITSVDTTAYTDASPTLPELYPKVADSVNEVSTNRYLPPQAIIMHPRRWFWACAQVDSTGRPFIVPTAQGPYNALAGQAGVAAEGPVGTMLGVPVYIDANVQTTVSSTYDVIYVTRPSDHWLFESSIRTRVLPEVGSGTLTVRLQLYSYLAFTAERYPRATSLVVGSGTTTPTF